MSETTREEAIAKVENVLRAWGLTYTKAERPMIAAEAVDALIKSGLLGLDQRSEMIETLRRQEADRAEAMGMDLLSFRADRV